MEERTANCNIVGVFDDYAAAERASRDLVNAGIPRESIQVKSNLMTGAAGHGGETTREHEEGGIKGFFHRIFGSDVPEEDQGHFAEAVRRGNAIVCVSAAGNQLERAAEIMNQHGAVDIDRKVAQFRQTGYERFDERAPAYSADEAARERDRFAREGSASIPVVQEELQVGKRIVRRGGVRVYSHVVEQPVEEQVRLREEHVRVERRPVDRPVSDADVAAMRDQSIEVTESVEEPVVNKRARVREEIVVGKEQTERTETVRDTVRHTEVKVDKTGAGAQVSGDYARDFRTDYDTNYARSGMGYETYEPAYNYGYRMASDQRYRGKSWSDVESDLRTDYLRNNPNSKWDQMKGAVRYGWERVTRKR